MSFLLDPPALVIIGFLAGKAFYLIMAFGDRLFKRGSSRRNLLIVGAAITLIFWAYSSLLYLNIVYFPWPLPMWYGGTDWMLNSGLPLGLTRTAGGDIIAIVIFATYPFWFYIGSELGLAGSKISKGRRLKERNRIITELVRTAFPTGGAIPPSGQDVDAQGSVEGLLRRIPPLFSDSLTLLLFVFDSRFFVFAFTGRWKRFVDLDAEKDSTWEKRKYMGVWESNPFLVSVTQVLRITVSYGYYTKPGVYKRIGYNGPLIPNPPPWYNQAPESGATATVVSGD